MNILIITVGKKIDDSYKKLILDYEKRIKHQVNIEWCFIANSGLEQKVARTQESSCIASKIKKDDYTILLDERGKMASNEELAGIIKDGNGKYKRIVFIIGGAYGVDDTLRKNVNYILKLSDLIFPHEIVRLILSEQIYRSIMILNNHPYHHK